jgi:excisionase family DNA binding protein
MMKKAVPIRESANREAPVLTVQDVAKYLQVRPSTIYRLLKQRHLPAFKIGKDWRFNKESVDRWCVDGERAEHL